MIDGRRYELSVNRYPRVIQIVAAHEIAGNRAQISLMVFCSSGVWSRPLTSPYLPYQPWAADTKKWYTPYKFDRKERNA